MRTWVRHSLNVGALTAGALLAGTGAAHAQPAMVSTDNVGIANGTQVFAPIQAPVDVCGNAAAVGGFATAGCEGGSAAELDPEWTFRHFQMLSTDNVGIGNGTQVFAPIQAPVNVCGNAVAVGGAAAAGCEGGANADLELPGSDRHKPKYDYQAASPVAADSPVAARVSTPGVEGVADASGTATMISSGNLGVLNGTQAAIPVQIPINICGNSIAVLGVATAACEGGARAS
ncbi:MAG TPA: chaplin family protein [Natronosporangium sp.]